jgi:predicted MPP superfamily phosphohydrolase
MKLLLTADLHFHNDWFRWLIEQAPNYDLVCIAGDLLDMFAVKSTREQAREVTGFIRELADIVPVAVCSGNHDNAGRLISHEPGRTFTNGSSIWARIRTSLRMGQRESWRI